MIRRVDGVGGAGNGGGEEKMRTLRPDFARRPAADFAFDF